MFRRAAVSRTGTARPSQATDLDSASQDLPSSAFSAFIVSCISLISICVKSSLNSLSWVFEVYHETTKPFFFLGNFEYSR